MAPHEVVRLVRDLHRRGAYPTFDADREGFLRAYDLTDRERTALVGNDLAALYEMGVHPMAVLFFGQDNLIPMPEYLKSIGAAQGRVSELRDIFGPDAVAAEGILAPNSAAGSPKPGHGSDGVSR